MPRAGALARRVPVCASTPGESTFMRATFHAVFRGFALSAAGLFALAATAPVDAQKRSATQNIDFATISCSQFIEDVASSSEDDVGALMLWLDGYLSGVTGDTVLRFDSLEAFGTNLVDRCAARGNERLLDAARKVGIE